MSPLRWVCAVFGVFCVVSIDLYSESAWENTWALVGCFFCFVVFVASKHISRYLSNPRKYADEVAAHKEKLRNDERFDRSTGGGE